MTENLWQELANRSVGEFIMEWLIGYSRHTAANYLSGIRKLEEFGLIKTSMNLQTFALLNHNNIIDAIKLIPDWQESSKQARAACYISFTAYLSRRFDGMIPRAQPKKGKNNPTFSKRVRK